MSRTAMLQAPSGETLAELPLYADLTEAPLSHYVAFTKELEAFNAPVSDEGESRPVNPVRVMCRAVSEFYGVDLETVLQGRVGDLTALQGEAAAQVDGTLSTLYGYAVGLLKAWQPRLLREDDAAFEYRGEVFRLPAWTVHGALGGASLPALTVREAIEALECERLAAGTIEATGDATGSVRFTQYLRLLAILARKDGETLPVSDSECEAFLTERTHFFRDLDTATALNVDFFLLSTSERFGKTNSVIGSFILPALRLCLEATLRPRRKPSARPKRTTTRFSAASAGGN